ncbi:tetratricopeptide repeat protein [Streptomyces formicae]|uniref:Putative transcriptional regulator n=1 Tax=Streptomyces formicae TaxID=1616117 RepID=A0A291Q1X8_9ACTN|nr:hypothetical protein [Streptomyces formicae]ATL25602.1 putative transcriptional regulator [Streptomyces formicae]
MARRDPNAQLAALLAEAGWSAGALARAINALGTTRGMVLRYSRASVASWLAGSRPSAPVPALAAQALTRRTGRRVIVEDTGLAQLPAPAQAAAVHPLEEADAVRRMTALCRDDTDPARRVFLTRTAYSPAAVALPDWPQKSRPHQPRSQRRATEADTQTLQDTARLFASLGNAHGGAHARSALAAYLADDASSLLSAPATETLHRQLLVGCAQLTHLLASMTADAGHPGLAQHYYRTALALAHEASHRPTYAITLRATSTLALRLGYLPTAARLAQAATDIAGSTVAPAAWSFLLSQRALTRAATSQSRLALADLDAAEHAHSRASIEPGAFSVYPRAGLDYQRAETFHALDQPVEALAAYQDAARHRAPAEHKLYALTQARLAESLLRIGHLEQACTHWHLFLDHYPHLRSAQADQVLAGLRRTLASFPRQPHATALRERAHSFTAPPGP